MKFFTIITSLFLLVFTNLSSDEELDKFFDDARYSDYFKMAYLINLIEKIDSSTTENYLM